MYSFRIIASPSCRPAYSVQPVSSPLGMCGIRLTRISCPFRCEPCDDVGRLLVRQRLRSIRAPTRHPFVRPPRDRDPPKGLVADQRKIGSIDNRSQHARTVVWIASYTLARRAVASRAEHSEGLLSPPGISR